DQRDLWGTDQQPDEDEPRARLSIPRAERIFYMRYATTEGMPLDEIYELTHSDRWFLDHMQQIVEEEERIAAVGPLHSWTAEDFRRAKRCGFSDRQISRLIGSKDMQVRARRIELGVKPVFKSVDTCAAEFEAYT